MCFQDEGKIAHLNLLIFPMSALSQWPSFKSILAPSQNYSVFQCITL